MYRKKTIKYTILTELQLTLPLSSLPLLPPPHTHMINTLFIGTFS